MFSNAIRLPSRRLLLKQTAAFSTTRPTLKGINKVILVGNLGNDPEYHEFPVKEGQTVDPARAGYWKLSLATSKSKRNEDGTFTDDTQWHRIKVYKPNLNDRVRKGATVYIEGELKYWHTEDGKNGVEIRAQALRLGSGRTIVR
ncbi:hypothetical protein DFS34DRAFT_453255 [Phlyctochytrium arcticum]|nr:hypothetical protein DFS34DRAFT_453255 [Phlyctochytrium arcticum]